MNVISVLRFLSERLFRRQPLRHVEVQGVEVQGVEVQGRRDDDEGDNFAAVTAPHGPRPRSGGAQARPRAPEDQARR